MHTALNGSYSLPAIPRSARKDRPPPFELPRGVIERIIASYSDVFQADVKRRLSPPHRQSLAQISQNLGIHQATLYPWRNGWNVAEMFTLVLESVVKAIAVDFL